MRLYQLLPALLAMLLLASIPAAAQLKPTEPDPLTRIRDAAVANVQACSVTGETLCEQVAPKIIANAQGDSPLAENVRHLSLSLTNTSDFSSADAVAWAVAAFRAAGVDARIEENSTPPVESGSSQTQQAIVAEIRGREKPDEWVLLGARIELGAPVAMRTACNAALVVEAARDIFLTHVSPRRSIRFVLLVNSANHMTGFWPYVHAHRKDLDSARAAIFFTDGADRIGSYMLSGRQDLNVGVREALQPIATWNVFADESGASILMGDFDFLLEGVPTMIANQKPSSESMHSARTASDLLNESDLKELKRNVAVAGVTAFGIAERMQPLGPRQTRSEIESLLNATILGEQLKAAGLWPLWESGERGRLP